MEAGCGGGLWFFRLMGEGPSPDASCLLLIIALNLEEVNLVLAIMFAPAGQGCCYYFHLEVSAVGCLLVLTSGLVVFSASPHLLGWAHVESSGSLAHNTP